jgi:hypothetical protein
VTLAAGDGSPKKANKTLKLFTTLVRKDKRNSGDKLPKAAKTAIDYFKEAKRMVEK